MSDWLPNVRSVRSSGWIRWPFCKIWCFLELKCVCLQVPLYTCFVCHRLLHICNHRGEKTSLPCTFCAFHQLRYDQASYDCVANHTSKHYWLAEGTNWIFTFYTFCLFELFIECAYFERNNTKYNKMTPQFSAQTGSSSISFILNQDCTLHFCVVWNLESESS